MVVAVEPVQAAGAANTVAAPAVVAEAVGVLLPSGSKFDPTEMRSASILIGIEQYVVRWRRLGSSFFGSEGRQRKHPHGFCALGRHARRHFTSEKYFIIEWNDEGRDGERDKRKASTHALTNGRVIGQGLRCRWCGRFDGQVENVVDGKDHDGVNTIEHGRYELRRGSVFRTHAGDCHRGYVRSDTS